MRPFLAHGSNAALLIAAAILALLFGLHAVAFTWWAAPLGAAIFFISEYTTHRFLFHARPSRFPLILRLQHRLHYDHHIDPSRLELLFLPLWFTIPVTTIYYAVYLALTHNAALSLSLTFGSLLALAYYEWVHYVAHIPFIPITPFGRWIKKYHLWHHFKNEHKWYGVTNPSMDLLMRTYQHVNEVQRSSSVREIWKSKT